MFEYLIQTCINVDPTLASIIRLPDILKIVVGAYSAVFITNHRNYFVNAE